MNTDFSSLVRWFGNDFQSWVLCLAGYVIREDPTIQISNLNSKGNITKYYGFLAAHVFTGQFTDENVMPFRCHIVYEKHWQTL